jgi:endonuclease/exonuclease/phosphatase (EEP) superfamily protein YafD
VVLILLFVVRLGGDRWWLATLLMFGPRWLFALPLGVLIPAAVVGARKALWPLAIGLFLVLVPLMGFCLPWRPMIDSTRPTLRVRVLTCNIHFSRVDVEALSSLISETEPDIVALQGSSEKHKAVLFGEKKWHSCRHGELCLGSRYSIRNAKVASEAVFKGSQGSLARYDLESPVGTIHFFNLHLASPRDGLRAALYEPQGAPGLIQANSDLRQSQAEIVRCWTEEVDGSMLIAGDFNTPPESTIHDEYWSSLGNGFEEAGFGWGHTYFSRWAAVRIDHQLGSSGWQCQRCWVGPKIGSPHHPVIADWMWTYPKD